MLPLIFISQETSYELPLVPEWPCYPQQSPVPCWWVPILMGLHSTLTTPWIRRLITSLHCCPVSQSGERWKDGLTPSTQWGHAGNWYVTLHQQQKGDEIRGYPFSKYSFPMQMCNRDFWHHFPLAGTKPAIRLFCDPEKANEKMCVCVIQTVSISCPIVFLNGQQISLVCSFLWQTKAPSGLFVGPVQSTKARGPWCLFKALLQGRPAGWPCPLLKSFSHWKPSQHLEFSTQTDEAGHWFPPISKWQVDNFSDYVHSCFRQ